MAKRFPVKLEFTVANTLDTDIRLMDLVNTVLREFSTSLVYITFPDGSASFLGRPDDEGLRRDERLAGDDG